MGVQSTLLSHRILSTLVQLFVWLYVFVASVEIVGGQKAKIATICDAVDECNCFKRVAQWENINCTLGSSQDLWVNRYNFSNEAAEVCFLGGQSINFGPQSFTGFKTFALLRVVGAKTIVMDKQSFVNLAHPSLTIYIENCDRLEIKTGAFENVQSTINIEITNCVSVSIQKTAFNFLASATFKDIPNLVLASGAFEFKNSKIVGDHGPVTKILFDKVTIAKLPPEAFFAVLSQLTITNSKITEIQQYAFYSTQISALSIHNTNIEYIRNGAILDKTLIYNLNISNCTIKRIESKAILAGISNFTIQHSKITDVQTGAVNISAALVEITDSTIHELNTACLVFSNLNRIIIQTNIFKKLHKNFLVLSPASDDYSFKIIFKENDLYFIDNGALNFVPDFKPEIVRFQNNFFNESCHCQIDRRASELMNSNDSVYIKKIMNTTFCNLSQFLAECFELKAGIIAINNFTELVCNNSDNTVHCEPYKGETKIVNTTSEIFLEHNDPHNTPWLTIIVTIAVCLGLITVVVLTFVLIKSSRWLKRKGYFRKIHYNQNEQSNDEENTIETVDESNQFVETNDDLTLELLHDLSRKLDDPNTHQEASEMIEQLYQKYIRNGDNNNQQQDEEAHLYEELGNLNLNLEQQPDLINSKGDSRSILKIMEEKFNLNFDEANEEYPIPRPSLVGEYSEPSDAAVHLYSELKQNRDDKDAECSDTLRSRASGTMASRPLPDKPGSSKMHD